VHNREGFVNLDDHLLVKIFSDLCAQVVSHPKIQSIDLRAPDIDPT